MEIIFKHMIELDWTQAMLLLFCELVRGVAKEKKHHSDEHLASNAVTSGEFSPNILISFTMPFMRIYPKPAAGFII